MSKKQGMKKNVNTSVSYMDRLTIKANRHDEEQRYFGRVFMADMFTIALGRLGIGEKRFERIDKVLTEVCDEYSTDIVTGAESDRDVWYQKGALDREMQKYTGKLFVKWEDRYGFKTPKPAPFTNLKNIRSMPAPELAKWLVERVSDSPWCKPDAPVDPVTKQCQLFDCEKCALEWLKQEAAVEK